MARRRSVELPGTQPRFLRLALALKAARENAGLSQRECAPLLGVSLGTLSTYELGVRSIPASRLLAAAKALNDRALAQLAPLGGTRRASGKVARPAPELADIFVRAAFTKWWADHAKLLCDEFPGTEQPDLDSAKAALLGWVTVTIRQLEQKYGTVAEKAVIGFCDDLFPNVRRLLQQLTDSRRHAA